MDRSFSVIGKGLALNFKPVDTIVLTFKINVKLFLYKKRNVENFS
jgi:hypothetical protein